MNHTPALLIAILATCALTLGLVAFRNTGTNPYSQRAFPCHEDEALIYAPQFGPDRVGCINVEEIN